MKTQTTAVKTGTKPIYPKKRKTIYSTFLCNQHLLQYIIQILLEYHFATFKKTNELNRPILWQKGYFCDRIGNLKIMSNKTRLESDSMGTIEVPAEHYWGAQTQRSLIHCLSSLLLRERIFLNQSRNNEPNTLITGSSMKYSC